MRAKEPTPIEAFLAPLDRLVRKHPLIEGMVFWGGAEGWDPSPSEALEAEEIAFYAEGLLLDGFHMDWALVAEGETPDHLRLCFWQEGDPPPPVAAPWHRLAGARWTPVS
ncbi:MAG: hypothetical protein J0L76_09785 [Rhodobacterales bacterium]|nr:hypothetical protein [Rhodobacterales bacterium]